MELAPAWSISTRVELSAPDWPDSGSLALPEEALRATVDSLHVLTATNDGAFLVGDPDFDPAIRGWDVAEVMLEVDRLRQMEQDVFAQGVTDGVRPEPRSRSRNSSHPPLRGVGSAVRPGSLIQPRFVAGSLWQLPGTSVPQRPAHAGSDRAGHESSGLLHIEVIPDSEPIVLNEVSVAEVPDTNTARARLARRSARRTDGFRRRYRDPHRRGRGDEDGHRRALRSVVTPAETTLVSNVLGDMRKLRTGQG